MCMRDEPAEFQKNGTLRHALGYRTGTSRTEKPQTSTPEV
jgi:hypothetical protein